MNHDHIISTTDPISGFDITDRKSRPHVVEGQDSSDLTIYFESKATLQAYLDIPVENQEQDLAKTMSNPAENFSG